MRLLLDEDTQARALTGLLRKQGHDVQTVAGLALDGAADAVVLHAAAADLRVLLTRNCADFLALHLASDDHAGILAIYQGPDPNGNMTHDAVARAVRNVESSLPDLARQFLALNAWIW